VLILLISRFVHPVYFLSFILRLHVLPKPSLKLNRLKPIARASSTNFPSRTRSLMDDGFNKMSSMCKVVFEQADDLLSLF
jgi:hypothetical protein